MIAGETLSGLIFLLQVFRNHKDIDLNQVCLLFLADKCLKTLCNGAEAKAA